MTKIPEIKPINKEMFAWISDTGSIQLPTLSLTPESCKSIIRSMHKKGLSKSVYELEMKGFTIQKVTANISTCETE